jgi:hypothetical protein
VSADWSAFDRVVDPDFLAMRDRHLGVLLDALGMTAADLSAAELRPLIQVAGEPWETVQRLAGVICRSREGSV